MYKFIQWDLNFLVVHSASSAYTFKSVILVAVFSRQLRVFVSLPVRQYVASHANFFTRVLTHVCCFCGGVSTLDLPPGKVTDGDDLVFRIRIRKIRIIFWPPGSGSVIYLYGSGSDSRSFHQQPNIWRKTLWLLYEFSSLKNYVNVPSKQKKPKVFWRLEGHEETGSRSNILYWKRASLFWLASFCPPPPFPPQISHHLSHLSFFSLYSICNYLQVAGVGGWSKKIKTWASSNTALYSLYQLTPVFSLLPVFGLGNSRHGQS